jgi:hypothetical protein
MEYVFDLHKLMVKKQLILVYEGEFTQEITKSVLSMAERNLESVGEEEGIRRKVFNVMVECLQNICKHTDQITEHNQERDSAVFIIGKESSEYSIISGNSIENVNIPNLEEKLKLINSLDKDGLKALYKEIISNTELSEKGGAGLGFVDMARKSGHKLEFSFHPVDNEYSFFVLKVKIGREKDK